ncbi:macrophage mannose receptor 1-like [Betta splendens]|uniref:Macrophage mannose receptor 1-like n=1 Tax=Betta splendens TaxID=158456 RepID=A0A6P7L773_BETSP|nr:macrophage mannose receptor 1-like [Betta splendens]
MVTIIITVMQHFSDLSFCPHSNNVCGLIVTAGREKMQWTLFLVVLMGQCLFSTCLLYQYHFIKEQKTWDEAQKYCRETYTDLATVSDMTDMKRLCSSTGNQDEAWIGLHSYPGKNNRMWYWSVPGLKFVDSQTRWGSGEPNDFMGILENCVVLYPQLWNDSPCSTKYTSVCYNETKPSGNTFHYVETPMTWPQAQSYCRQHYTDLVSGLDQVDNPSVKSRSYSWIGLFRDSWRWSDGSYSSFRNWQSDGDLVDGQSNKTCATVSNTAGTWSSDYCNKQKPFYCYGAPRTDVRVTLTAAPSVTKTDPAVPETMLREMEAVFRDKGISVRLSWRKLSDKLHTIREEPEQSTCSFIQICQYSN